MALATPPRPAAAHAEIRRRVAAFEAVRRAADPYDCDPEGESRAAFDALGEAIADAGYAAVIVGGLFYSSPRLIPELGDGGDDFGAEVYRAALILDLDAEGGVR